MGLLAGRSRPRKRDKREKRGMGRGDFARKFRKGLFLFFFLFPDYSLFLILNLARFLLEFKYVFHSIKS